MWIKAQDLDIHHAKIFYRFAIKLVIKQPLFCGKLCLPQTVNCIIDYDFHRRKSHKTFEIEYLCEIHVFEDAFFLPLLGFSAFLGTNILREINPQCWLRRSISVASSIQYPSPHPKRCTALTSTERINLNFYWKAICWLWLKKNADWRLVTRIKQSFWDCSESKEMAKQKIQKQPSQVNLQVPAK